MEGTVEPTAGRAKALSPDYPHGVAGRALEPQVLLCRIRPPQSGRTFTRMFLKYTLLMLPGIGGCP